LNALAAPWATIVLLCASRGRRYREDGWLGRDEVAAQGRHEPARHAHAPARSDAHEPLVGHVFPTSSRATSGSRCDAAPSRCPTGAPPPSPSSSTAFRAAATGAVRAPTRSVLRPARPSSFKVAPQPMHGPDLRVRRNVSRLRWLCGLDCGSWVYLHGVVRASCKRRVLALRSRVHAVAERRARRRMCCTRTGDGIRQRCHSARLWMGLSVSARGTRPKHMSRWYFTVCHCKRAPDVRTGRLGRLPDPDGGARGKRVTSDFRFNRVQPAPFCVHLHFTIQSSSRQKY